MFTRSVFLALPGAVATFLVFCKRLLGLRSCFLVFSSFLYYDFAWSQVKTHIPEFFDIV